MYGEVVSCSARGFVARLENVFTTTPFFPSYLPFLVYFSMRKGAREGGSSEGGKEKSFLMKIERNRQKYK